MLIKKSNLTGTFYFPPGGSPTSYVPLFFYHISKIIHMIQILILFTVNVKLHNINPFILRVEFGFSPKNLEDMFDS